MPTQIGYHPQFDSPSYLFAKHVVDTYPHSHDHLGSPDPLRSLRIKKRMHETCKIIFDRINTLRAIFDSIVGGFNRLEHVNLIRKYEEEFYLKLEVTSLYISEGFHYLNNESWIAIEGVARSIEAKGTKILSSSIIGGLQIIREFTIKAIWEKIKPESSSHRRLQDPFETRYMEIQQILAKINSECVGRRLDVAPMSLEWTEDVENYLKHCSKVLLPLLSWIELTDGLDQILQDPRMIHAAILVTTRVYIEGLLSTPPPPYTQAQSLRHVYRVGLRQKSLRPEVISRRITFEQQHI